MKNRVDLKRRVLGVLREVFPGEPWTDDDLATVDGHIDGKIAELSRRRVMHIADADAIDDELFQPLAKLVANAVAPEFGKPFDPVVDAREEQRLREMQLEPDPGETVMANYF